MIESEVLALIAEHADVVSPAAPLGLDSLTLVVLIEALEARWGILVPSADLVPAHFGTASAVAAYVARRLSEPR